MNALPVLEDSVSTCFSTTSVSCWISTVTIIAHSFFGLDFVDPGGLAVWFTQVMPISIQTSLAVLLVLPSPPTRVSLSLHCPRRPSPQYLPTSSSPSLSNLLAKYNEEVMGSIISTLVPGSSYTNSNCNQTHRNTGHFTCVFIISKLCAEA